MPGDHSALARLELPRVLLNLAIPNERRLLRASKAPSAGGSLEMQTICHRTQGEILQELRRRPICGEPPAREPKQDKGRLHHQPEQPGQRGGRGDISTDMEKEGGSLY